MLNPIALSETYRECLPTLKHYARRHWKKYGGRLEDVQATADLVFIVAYHEYDYEKSPFDFFLKMRLKRRLFNEERAELRRGKLLKRSELDPDEIEDDVHEFRLDEFVISLSKDACTAVKIAFSPKYEREKDSRKIRSGIRKRLKSIGWSDARIKKVFEEIRSKL